MSQNPEITDRGFTRAVVAGILVGIPAIALASFLAFEAARPHASVGALASLAIWTGLWVGVFFGGTIAVGVYLHKLEH